MQQLQGKRVLVIGAGNSGCDMYSIHLLSPSPPPPHRGLKNCFFFFFCITVQWKRPDLPSLHTVAIVEVLKQAIQPEDLTIM